MPPVQQPPGADLAQRIYDSLPAPAFVVDSGRRVRHLNGAARELWPHARPGSSLEDLLSGAVINDFPWGATGELRGARMAGPLLSETVALHAPSDDPPLWLICIHLLDQSEKAGDEDWMEDAGEGVALPDCIWILDEHLRFLELSGPLVAQAPEYAAILGSGLEDVASLSPDKEVILAAHRQALQGETASYSSEWIGEGRLWCRVTPRFTAEGRCGVAGCAYRSARLSQMRRGARVARIRQQVLLDHLPQPVAFKQAGGVYEVVNRAFAEAAGRSVQEIPSLTTEDLFSPEVARRAVRRDREAMESRAPVTSIESVDGPEGRRTWEVVRVPILENDQVFGVVVISTDITEREAIRQRLEEAAAQLKQRNAELLLFAYNASHDLQEPLRTIGGFAGLLKRRNAAELDQEALEYLEYMIDASRRLQNLVHDLLVYARTGVDEPVSSRVDLDLLLVQLRRDLQTSLDAAEAELHCSLLPDVWGDRAQLYRLFQNLLTNCTRFAGKRPLRIHVAAEKQGEQVRIQVADNGMGVDAAEHEKIFEPFTRLGGPAGSGLGLAICRRIAAAHGGRIHAAQSDEGGLKVIVELPATKSG